MCPHGYHHNDFMVTPALGTQEVRFWYLHYIDCISVYWILERYGTLPRVLQLVTCVIRYRPMTIFLLCDIRSFLDAVVKDAPYHLISEELRYKFCPPDTYHCQVSSGCIEWEVCVTRVHMTSCGTRPLDLESNALSTRPHAPSMFIVSCVVSTDSTYILSRINILSQMSLTLFAYRGKQCSYQVTLVSQKGTEIHVQFQSSVFSEHHVLYCTEL